MIQFEKDGDIIETSETNERGIFILELKGYTRV